MPDLSAMSDEERRALRHALLLSEARESLAGWCEAGPPTELGPLRLYRWQRDCATRLEEAYRWAAVRDTSRTIRIILIDALPQLGKSELVSRRGPVWGMATLGLSFGVASYAASLAEEHSIAARQLARSEQATAVWPHLARDTGRRQRQDDWTVPVVDPEMPGARYLARGRDGALTGRMVDVITLDDMYKDIGDYSSLASRREVDGFLRTSAAARLMERGGLLVDMGTRWGTQDTKAWWHAKVEEMRRLGLDVNFEHWSYPLRARENDTMGREPGEYISDNWTPEKEAAARALYGEDHRAILDCDPVDPSGGLYKRDRHLCHHYDEPPSVARVLCRARYLSVDAAETEGGGDWTVVQEWGIRERDGKLLWLSQVRVQVDSLGVVRVVGAERDRARPNASLIENTSGGKVANAVLGGRVPGIVPVSVSGKGSKRDRIRGTLALWANGDVLVPRDLGDETAWYYGRDKDGLNVPDRLCMLRGERPDMRGEVDDEADAATIFLTHYIDELSGAEGPSYEDIAAAAAEVGPLW